MQTIYSARCIVSFILERYPNIQMRLAYRLWIRTAAVADIPHRRLDCDTRCTRRHHRKSLARYQQLPSICVPDKTELFWIICTLAGSLQCTAKDFAQIRIDEPHVDISEYLSLQINNCNILAQLSRLTRFIRVRDRTRAHMSRDRDWGYATLPSLCG